MVVSEPDLRKNWKEGLGDRLGWKCAMYPECRHASDWFIIASLRAFIGNTNHSSMGWIIAESSGEINCWSIA